MITAISFNIVGLILLFVSWAILFSVISAILSGISINPISITLNGFASSILGSLLAIYAIAILLDKFDVSLSIITVAVWGVLQLIGSSRSGVKILLQKQSLNFREQTLVEQRDGLNLETQKYLSLGQFWGLVVGIILGVILLIIY